MSIGYVTVAEANAYLAAHYSATDESLARWDELEDADKAVYLLRSAEALDALPYTGRRYALDQPFAFPRWPNSTVPAAVKAAQMENALKLSDVAATEDAALYEKMNLYGIKSYSIGNLSESLTPGAIAYSDVVSAKAMQLLKQYCTGGYGIG